MSAGLKLEQQEGDLPASWELVAIDDVCTLGGGKTPRKSNDKYWNGSIPWVSPKDFDGVTLDETEDKLTEYGVSENSINLYDAGDIAMVVRSGVLRHSLPTAQLESEMAVNQDVKVLQPDFTKITSDYLLNILLYEADRFRASCVKTGTTVESVETAFLKAYKLPLPPLPEQNRIADILSTVDEQIQQTEEIIQERKELKRGLMQDLLLRGIGHKEFQEQRLGLREISIPKSWSVQSADSIFDIKKTGFDPSEHTGEVYLYSMPAFDEGKKPLLTQAEEIGSKKRIVPNDTILFPKLNIRKKRFWRVHHNQNLPAICSTEYWPLTAKENIDLDFYTFYFQSYPFMSDPKVSSSSSTNSHKRVTQSSFKKVQLPVPPAEEQKKIANILNLCNKKIEQGYGRKKELLKLKRGLMQDLLTGTVRVDPEQA